MKKVKTEDAVGLVLFHDITKIVKDSFKGVAFKKGHVVTEEDIPELLSIGKDHLYIWEETEGFLHENDAAERLKTLVCGEGIEFSELSEGKIEFIAKIDGYLKINIEELFKINMMDDLMVSTIFGNKPIQKGTRIGATRVIPLIIDEEKIINAEKIIKNPIIEVLPFKGKKTALIVTGNEIFHGRIKDAFRPAIEKKLAPSGSEIISFEILPDDLDKITKAILNAIELGAELILCTGGMSVDPDDLTPSAIKNAGGEIVSYGTPVLPGAMALVSYYKDIPIMGLPGSVMFFEKTVFDYLLSFVLIGEKITKESIATLGYGGVL